MLTAFILSLLLVSALIEEGTGLYSLVCACHKGHLDRVREEVHAGVNIKSKDEIGRDHQSKKKIKKNYFMP